MAGGGGRLDDEMIREKKERKNNVIITGIGGIRGNKEREVEQWLER
jgi:hypothetical protein